MPPKLNVENGSRYGLWTVIGYAESSRHGDRMYQCVCECGRENKVSARQLQSGRSACCGCVGAKRHAEKFTTHGQSDSKLYKVWSSMKRRCSAPDDPSYCNYGGRGIVVCDEWKTFIPFHAWALLSGYREGLTIESINNDKGYSPDNCEWIPKPQQSKNTRHCVMISYEGHTLNISDWAKRLGVPYARIQSRLKKGWNIKSAL